jgi:hypothetical protein
MNRAGNALKTPRYIGRSSSVRRNSRSACSSGQSDLHGVEPYSFLMNFPPSTPNFEETPRVAIEQRGAAEAAIDGVSETIDSVTSLTELLYWSC